MKLVIFGLSISSSWGNGHATLWRGLCKALASRGHSVVFFEKDVPWYAAARDATEFPGCELRLYDKWADVAAAARDEMASADVGMVTSYCPDGIDAAKIVLDSPVHTRCFYDLDTPVTLSRLDDGQRVEYLPPQGLSDFDLVLSYTGGEALRRLQSDLGARRVAPLYGSVDPEVHCPGEASRAFEGELSYLGTYAEDRQDTLVKLFIEPARRRAERRFVLGGAQYPDDFPWTDNIFFVRHLGADLHSTFYASSRLTLNVTRKAMASMGYCPSGRLFEAAACGVPVLTDVWEGLDTFYNERSEMLYCRGTDDVLDALEMSDRELRQIAVAARERTLSEHTALHRVMRLEAVLQNTACAAQA